MTMASSKKLKERRDQVARYRLMEQETTDPLAARLLRDIVSDLEAETEEPRTACCEIALVSRVTSSHH
jgi:hypothetical protein